MWNSYSDWLGKPVILGISSSGLGVVLPCTLLSETEDRLRIRLEDAWDVDVYKQMVQSIEAAVCAKVT